ncbi:D-alanyl-D-alanine carboxypeptidase / D-alanyl-D-alanine-endopeptidase (penicillin-binding protein 4) [Spirosomataceae bacterium TFI 002]|nr:D-alanyl-D-alanine carboxypeptidase / D-alanyl-D-alanine-endopeptidase (penicillin-binding protein 4) [Spirosomataceae bacterium TFI 002]
MIKTLAFILIQIGSINQNIISQIDAFQKSNGIKNGIVSVHVRDCSTDKELLSYNADKSVNSASILKLVSTGAILKYFGPDFKFRTDIKYTGEIINGVISGDLIIKSDGDPSLGSHRYTSTSNFGIELMLALQNIGIKGVKGDLKVIDPDYFKFHHPDSWIWGDIGNYYGSMPHQFNYNENFYTVYFDASHQEGGDVEIKSLKPYSKTWEINNTVKAGPRGSGDQVYIYTAPNSQKILMKGTVPAGAKGFSVKGSIPHPAAVFKEFLIDQLAFNSIIVEHPSYQSGSFFENDTPSFQLHEIFSPSLSELIIDCNFQSINLFADAFIQKIYAEESGTYNLIEAADFVQDFWKKSGAETEGFSIKDGSGLSPSGLVTGQGMTSILSIMAKDHNFDYFLNSIPVLGESGTVKYLDRKNITQGRVHAKSGSITGTRSYAGYSKTKDDRLIAFSIIVNRYDNSQKNKVREFLENILLQTIDINQ